MTRRDLAACVLALACVAAAPPEPDDYRTADYGAPTPATLRGARVLAAAEAHALWQAHAAAFIDVLPRPPRPAGLPPGTLWRDAPHADIPGSLWLPDTGYGALAPPMQAYFARGLEAASGGDAARLLVFYCKPACWMSWNAARRALALGYRNVGWYPGGAPEWRRAGWPVEDRQPARRPGEQAPALSPAPSGSPAPAHTAAVQ